MEIHKYLHLDVSCDIIDTCTLALSILKRERIFGSGCRVTCL